MYSHMYHVYMYSIYVAVIVMSYTGIAFKWIFVRSDCRHFGVDVPEFSTAEGLQADITRFEKMWSLYDEFHTGLLEMTKEDWISFR